MRFRRRLKPVAGVELVPMIDVVFQLVVFFMVSSTFIQTPGIGITLPRSRTTEAVVMGRLVVTVVAHDQVYLNRDRYDLAGLERALAALRAEGGPEERSVILEGDTSVPYELLVGVLDALRKNGYTGVNLRMREARN